MKASTVFIFALCLLIALAGLAGAKHYGLFDKKPEPPPPVAEKPAPVKVLVAAVNLYEDIAVAGAQTTIRELSPEDVKSFTERYGPKWQEKFLPATVGAAHMRVPRENIQADQPLRRDQFYDPALPDQLTARLDPNTRAVNVSMPKNKAGGGAIRIKEFVDVMLTTKVMDAGREEVRTACIARSCKVIMKRNNPWTIMGTDAEDKPLDFTLQANPYRAALIEYAQTYGQISLQPISTPIKTTGTFSDPASKEYASEDQRVEEVTQGVRTIGDEDLMRIFKVRPAVPAPPKPQPFVIEHLSGVSLAGSSSLAVPGKATTLTSSDSPPASAPVVPAGGVAPAPVGANSGPAFRLPNATGDTSAAGCKDCDAKKKAAEAAKGRVVGGN